MFWRFGGYANISTIDSVLDKPDVTLEEVLEESDLLQELKQQNTKLIEFLRDDAVFYKLLEYVVSPSLISEDDKLAEEEEEEEQQKKESKSAFSPVRSLSLGRSRVEKSKQEEVREERQSQEKARQKHAFIASEILSSEVWSITETLMESRESLVSFWDFLRQPPALDPVTAGYFTKINETLLDKKTEETLDFIKSLDGIVPAMLQHVDCPMIMDLLLKIISMDKTEGGQGIVDWLQSQDLMPSLLAFLGEDHPSFTQTSAGDFIKAIITISANASQNEQSCIGPNSLTRQLVSEACIKSMIANMLKGGNSLTVGVGIIIEVIRKNNSDYDPVLSTGQELPPSSGDPIYLGTLLRQFAIHVPQFMALILSSRHTVADGNATISTIRRELPMAFGKPIEPLGFDRFKTCELMAELLHCSNMGLLNERGSEAYVHQRDTERERLRIEGKFSKIQEPPSATTEFSEDGIDHASESPELISRPFESKRHEISGDDDDGFEDVGSSKELADTMRNDFEPFSDIAESASPLRPSKSRLSLDDEFFDEPLHSPHRSNNSDVNEITNETGQRAHSPSLPSISENHKSETQQAEHDINSPTIPTITTTDDLFAEIDAQLLPAKDKQDSTYTTNGEHDLSVNNGSLNTHTLGNMSPHSDDTPAPLFSPVPDQSKHNQDMSDGQSTPTQVPASNDEHWSDQAIDDWAPHIENDIDGSPIVGDFLKMQFVEHRVVPTILDFFFRFPWNNFLHNVVYDVVQQVFNGSMERGYNRALAIDLFTNGRLTERVIEGQLRSDEVQAGTNLRLGYMGHLTLIAEEVVKFSERHPVKVLSEPVLNRVTERIWTDYVENVLSETRERDNAILGGVRPDAAGGARQAILESVGNNAAFSNTGSAALANAGLNGGSVGLDSMDLTNQTGGNFLSGGASLSGFGSSSDEEDEDMEEITAETEGTGSDNTRYNSTGFKASKLSKSAAKDNEASDYSSDDQGNVVLTPSSSGTSEGETSNEVQDTQESGPFLPPPLKIPPSRARKQLAVRLALKEKERQEEQQKAKASITEDGTIEVPARGIFSPTEGQISTPDTPAFTPGGKIHERGLHAQYSATPASRRLAESTQDTTSPVQSDGGFSDNGDPEDDPWASLDAAVVEAIAGSKHENGHESMEKPSNTDALSDSNQTQSSSGSESPLTGKSKQSLNNVHENISSNSTDSSTSSHPIRQNDNNDTEEMVVIGFNGTTATHKQSGPADADDDASTEKTTTETKSHGPLSTNSPPTSSHTRSRSDNSNRSAMSRLFQSWQGEATTPTHDDKAE